jgi:hypothetical protein
MFILNWLFDKLGYMPKINVEVGVACKPWPFPAEVEVESLAKEPKPITKPKVAKKPATKRTSTRKPKAK